MNLSCSWIAVKGPDKETVLSTLDWLEAAPGSNPDLNWAEMIVTASGWIVIFIHDFNYPTPKRMAAVSVGGTAVACSIDERVMYSVARGYADGQAVWSVDHDGGQRGHYHLSIAGDPPPELAAVRARLTAEQDAAGGDGARVDYLFDLPASLTEALTGFNLPPEGQGIDTVALEPAPSKGGGLFAALGGLFGRKSRSA